MVSGLVLGARRPGGDGFPAALFSDHNFAMFSAKRDGAVVAGGTLYRADGVVGLSNVVAEADDEPCRVARPRLARRGDVSRACRWWATNRATSCKAAHEAGFEIGDPLRVWVEWRGS